LGRIRAEVPPLGVPPPVELRPYTSCPFVRAYVIFTVAFCLVAFFFYLHFFEFFTTELLFLLMTSFSAAGVRVFADNPGPSWLSALVCRSAAAYRPAAGCFGLCLPRPASSTFLPFQNSLFFSFSSSFLPHRPICLVLIPWVRLSILTFSFSLRRATSPIRRGGRASRLTDGPRTAAGVRPWRRVNGVPASGALPGWETAHPLPADASPRTGLARTRGRARPRPAARAVAVGHAPLSSVFLVAFWPAALTVLVLDRRVGTVTAPEVPRPSHDAGRWWNVS